MNSLRIMVAVGMAAFPAVFFGAAADRAELHALRAQVQALEQQLRELSRQLDLKEQAMAAAAPSAAPDDLGFSIAPANRQHRLRFKANLQADARFFLGNERDANDTFLIRRLPLNFEADLGERLSARIMPDVAQSNLTLLEAYAKYQHSPALNVLVGKTKSPFDLERLVAQTDLLFLERSFPTQLSPNRDIGVQMFGDLLAGTLGYQLGWVDGTRDYDSTVTDGDDGKEIVARAFAHPFRNVAGTIWRGLGIGVAMSRGEKSAGSPNAFRTHAQQTFFAWAPTVVNNGKHTRLEPQGYLYAGPLGLIGSWVTSRQALCNGAGSAARDIKSTAWYGAISWVLTGEDAGYRGVTPAKTFNWSERSWGAWEIAARLDELRVSRDAFPLFVDNTMAPDTATGSTLGVNWYLTRNLKASLNFEHTAFDRGGSGPAPREDEDVIVSRVQVRY